MNRQDSSSTTSSTSSIDPPSYYEKAYIKPLKQGRPTVVPVSEFNAHWDAVRLYKALRIGDKKGITNILCKRSCSQRMEIVTAYKSGYKLSLAGDIKSTVSGEVRYVYLGLLMTVPELYCRQVKKSRNDGSLVYAVLTLNLSPETVNGDDQILIEILCTSTNAEIKKICGLFHKQRGKRLEQMIHEDKLGSYKKFLEILASANRDESNKIDVKAAKCDAEIIAKLLSKSIVDEKPMLEIFGAKSFSQIRILEDEYKKLTGSSLESSIKTKFSDNLRDALVTIIRTSVNPHEQFARRINKAINYHVLDERPLTRLIIARSEIDLMDVKEEFGRIFRKSLKSRLKGDIKGNYKLALLTLLGDD